MIRYVQDRRVTKKVATVNFEGGEAFHPVNTEVKDKEDLSSSPGWCCAKCGSIPEPEPAGKS